MAYSRLVARVGIVGLVGLLSAIACSSDENKHEGEASAGQAGESGGHAGSSTQGGSANKAGNGGTAGQGGKGGSAGSAGTGGVANGGHGGTTPAGAGGEAPGGTANEGGGGNGAGGDSGGAGGAGGAPEIKAPQCTYGCMMDADCVGGPVETCDQVTHQCAAPPPMCATDADCVPSVNQWVTCETVANCDDGYACVKWQDQGYCALAPAPDCADGVITKLPVFGGVGDVDVCASADPRCFSGACSPGCGDPNSGGCGIGSGDSCSAVTGTCECQQGTECTTGVCGKNSQCVQCVTDDDCAGLAAYGQDKCVAGSCGCSAAGVCPTQGYANATVGCQ